MKKYILASILGLSFGLSFSVSAHAAGTRSFQVSNLALSCKDASLAIPGNSISAEVFAATQATPKMRLKITRNTMNFDQEVLFDGLVNEHLGVRKSALEAENARLEVIANNDGEIFGQIFLKDDSATGADTLIIPVTCQKFYQIMKSASELE